MKREEHLNRIQEADKAYYDDAATIMEDEEYDALRDDYIQKYGIQDLEYVPGGTVTSRKFRHLVEVISLDKVDEDDVKNLDDEIKRLTPLVIEPKYDGITIVAYPKEDGSYFFVTRGNGREGAGGKVVNSVSGRTDYLVITDSDSQSTKARKARELGVQFVTPELLEYMFKKEE